MADPMVVVSCLRIMWAAQRPGSKLDEETEQTLLAAWAPALVDFPDDVVKAATSEWMKTSLFLPKPVEFVEVARRYRTAMFDRKALGTGLDPRPAPALGKPGGEGLATAITIRRMLREVARTSPKGYLGRWAGLSGDTHPGPGLEGHAMTPEGHDPDCQRCWLLAAVAYEQAIKFEDSSLTAESWLADSPPGLRSCRNEWCDHGWVTLSTMEDGRLVDRVSKCPTCAGPQAPRAKVEPKEGDGTTVVKRRRRRSW